jgi:hypothetical protein
MDKGKGIGLGVFLLTIGIIWALFNMDIINWSIFDSLLVLWPLILVVIGISVIFRRNWIVRLSAWLVFLAVLIGYGYYFGDERPYEASMKPAEEVTVEKPGSLQKSELKLSLGACSIKVESGTASLLEGSVKSRDIKYSSEFNSDNTGAVIFFNQKQRTDLHLGKGPTNSFKLNEDVAWDIKVDTGASTSNLDLSKLKVDSFEYDGGASRLKVVFGDRNDYTKVKIDTGVSQIDISIPETAGIRVRTDKGLSNTDFNGAGWIQKNHVYETENYEQASCQFEIDADIGVSNLNVNRIGK